MNLTCPYNPEVREATNKARLSALEGRCFSSKKPFKVSSCWNCWEENNIRSKTRHWQKANRKRLIELVATPLTTEDYSPVTSMVDEDTPYPYPTNFLPDPLTTTSAASPTTYNATEIVKSTTCETWSDDNDCQSIRSYDVQDKIIHTSRHKDKKMFCHHGGDGAVQNNNTTTTSSQNPFPLLSKVPGDPVDLNGTTLGQNSDSRKNILSETYIEMARCVHQLLIHTIYLPTFSTKMPKFAQSILWENVIYPPIYLVRIDTLKPTSTMLTWQK